MFLLLLFLLYLPAKGSVMAQVTDSADQIKPLLPGMKAPDVLFKNLDGTAFSLREAVSQKPTILIFYRGGW
jgi:hypothetical protein